VSGEAILSAENSGKPLGGQGSTLNPAGGAHNAPPDPLPGGNGCCLSPRTPPSLSAFGPLFLTYHCNEISWARAYQQFNCVSKIQMMSTGDSSDVLQ